MHVLPERNRNILLCGTLGMLLLATSAAPWAGDTTRSIFLVQEDDQVTAANTATGQFFDLELSAKERVEKKVSAKAVGIVVTNQRFAGIGGWPSGWSSTRREAGERLVSIEAEDTSAVVVTTDRVLIFNGMAGAWTEKSR